jgi:hypothetical protein
VGYASVLTIKHIVILLDIIHGQSVLKHVSEASSEGRLLPVTDVRTKAYSVRSPCKILTSFDQEGQHSRLSSTHRSAEDESRTKFRNIAVQTIQTN